MNKQRLKILLANTLSCIEDYVGDVMGTDLEDEIGITQEEYDEITVNTSEENHNKELLHVYIEQGNLIVEKGGKVHKFKIVDKVPARYGVWPIGGIEGTNEYVPFCEPQRERGSYAINPDTLLAVKLPVHQVQILTATATFCGGTIAEYENFLGNSASMWPFTSKDIVKAIDILKTITEDK